jgi:ferredoxin
VVGIEKLPNLHFKKPIVSGKLTKRILRTLKERPIVVDEKKCIKCGLCAKKCPAKAIKLKPFPVIDKKKCIRCFCCMEICPEDALSLKE